MNKKFNLHIEVIKTFMDVNNSLFLQDFSLNTNSLINDACACLSNEYATHYVSKSIFDLLVNSNINNENEYKEKIKKFTLDKKNYSNTAIIPPEKVLNILISDNNKLKLTTERIIEIIKFSSCRLITKKNEYSGANFPKTFFQYSSKDFLNLDVHYKDKLKLEIIKIFNYSLIEFNSLSKKRDIIEHKILILSDIISKSMESGNFYKEEMQSTWISQIRKCSEIDRDYHNQVQYRTKEAIDQLHKAYPNWDDKTDNYFTAATKLKYVNEHMVPAFATYQILLKFEDTSVNGIFELLKKITIRASITSEEDQILRDLKLTKTCPDNFHNKTSTDYLNPYLRYKEAGIYKNLVRY